MKISDVIDNLIKKTVDNFDGSYTCGCSFSDLLSFGELVDRLSIINFKLYNLKDNVMDRQEDKEFCSWAAREDVNLVEERSRLKRCIDEKLIAIIQKLLSGDCKGGFNPEVKKYGDIKK